MWAPVCAKSLFDCVRARCGSSQRPTFHPSPVAQWLERPARSHQIPSTALGFFFRADAILTFNKRCNTHFVGLKEGRENLGLGLK